MPSSVKKGRLYEFFGIKFTKESGDELIGKCPLCEKKDHFYVNDNTGCYKCFRCQSAGSAETFLKEFWAINLDKTTSADISELAKWRNLPVEAFEPWKIAFDGKRYLIPYFKNDGSLNNLRVCQIDTGKKIITPPHMEADLYGIWQFSKESNSSPIYLCAGEWDAISLLWLTNITSNQMLCLGVPGEGTFKESWIRHFMRRNVVVCYDNDNAGERGALAVRKNIERSCQAISFINWPEGFPEGYDLNDIISDLAYRQEKPTVCYQTIQSFIKPWHKLDPKTEKQKLRKLRAHSGPIPKFDEVIKVFCESLSLTDELVNATKLATATVFSTYLGRKNPVWIDLVGPPGCGKTSIITAFRKAKDCYFQSTLNPKALISGFRHSKSEENDPSLLAHLENKTLFIKDKTEILARSSTEKQEVYGIMRGAFDGYAEKDFGNGKLARYECHFSCISGVTSVIYAEDASSAGLGERFLKYYVGQDSEELIVDQHTKAMYSAIHGGDADENMMEVINRFLNREIKIPAGDLDRMVPKWFRTGLSVMVRLCSRLRTPIQRHQQGIFREDVQFTPEVETGNRLIVQLQKLAIALALVEEKAEIDYEIFELIRTICFDINRGMYCNICKFLAQQNGHLVGWKDISEALGITSSNSGLHMENMRLAGLIEKIAIPKGESKFGAFGFRLNSQIKDQWNFLAEFNV